MPSSQWPTASWVGKGVLCALAGLLLGCPGGPDDEAPPEEDRVVYRPAWMLDTAVAVKQLLDKDACAGSICTDRSAELRRVCAEVVPADGWIWTRSASGNSCRCRCPDWSKTTLWEVDSIKKTRQLLEATMASKRKAAWDAMKAHWKPDSLSNAQPSKKKEKKPFKKDQLVEYVWDPSKDCTATPGTPVRVVMDCFWPFWPGKEAMALWAFNLYAHPDNYPIFTYSIDRTSTFDYPYNNASWEELRGWEIGTGETEDPRLSITFPIGFVDAPEVRWELMLFFIGHEIGHALGDSVPCSIYGQIVCEAQCDHWGASVGLRRVVGDGLFCSSYSEIAEAAASQLEDYMERIHMDDAECGAPLCPPPFCEMDRPSCGYPPRDCRAETIRAAIDLLPQPICSITWYTDPARPSGCRGPMLPGGDDCPE